MELIDLGQAFRSARTASLTMVLNGQRNPGPEMVDAFIKYFKFTTEQADYFEALVSLKKVKGNSQLEYLILKKLQDRFPLKNVEFIDDRVFEFISQPYHVALRQLIRLKVFKNDLEWIANQLNFPISPKKIKESFELLKSLGLVQVKGKTLVSKDASLQTKNDIPSEAVKKFHEHVLENCKTMVRTALVEERDLQSLSFAFKSNDLPQAKKMLREFMHKFNQTFDSDQGDQVYQLNLQFIPLTKKEKNI